MPTYTCRACNQEFPFEPVEQSTLEMLTFKSPTICLPCYEKRLKERLRQETINRLARWSTLCPPLYRDTNLTHPAMPAPAKLAKILGWQYGPKGLLVHGSSRKCKTRCVWLLIHRLMVTDGLPVIGMTCGEFSRQCADAHGRGGEYAMDWIERLMHIPVLFIDDLGKSKMTERVIADLFEIFEHRCNHKLPTLFTTNFVGQTLAEKLTHHGDEASYQHTPFIARLREFCEAVSV